MQDEHPDHQDEDDGVEEQHCKEWCQEDAVTNAKLCAAEKATKKYIIV